MHNNQDNNLNSKPLEFPVNKDNEPSFLVQPEMLAFLNYLKAEAETAVLQQIHDLANPMEGIKQVIHQQGKLVIIDELLLIHLRKTTEGSEE